MGVAYSLQVNGVRLIINDEDVEFMKMLRLSQGEVVKNGIMPKIMQVSNHGNRLLPHQLITL